MKRVWKPAVGIVMTIMILWTCIPTAAAAGTTSAVTDFSVSNYYSLLEAAAQRYIARDPAFTVRYTASLSEVQSKLVQGGPFFNDIFSIDIPGTTSDLDYLRNNMSQMSVRWRHNGTYAVCEFTQTYLTTASQENNVNITVSKALRDLALANSSVYGKIKAIYDYIILTVDYDFTYSRYSAYDALYARTAVCQGYALLMYKMLIEAGVPVRLVSGEAVTGGERGAHAWNIVKIGRYWYNMDVTWDDSYDTEKYFLKNNAGFSDHYRDSKFSTAAFNAAHPMSPYDFDPAQDVKPVSGIALTPEDTVYAVGDVFMLSAVVTPADATDKTLSWASSDSGVATVDGGGYVTVIGPGTAVISASATDGTGKSADFTLTAHVPDTPDIWAADYISALFARGVIPPELNARFRDVITRAEFMALIANVYQYAKGSVVSAGGIPFTDISVSPYKDQIAFCYQLGIIEGDGTLFRPDTALTREQCAKILGSTIGTINGTDISSAAVLPYADSRLISPWAAAYVRYAYETGLMVGGDGYFNPQQNLTREQAMMVAERMIEKFDG